MKECEEKKDLEIQSDVNLEWVEDSDKRSDEKASYLVALGGCRKGKIKAGNFACVAITHDDTNTSTRLV